MISETMKNFGPHRFASLYEVFGLCIQIPAVYDEKNSPVLGVRAFMCVNLCVFRFCVPNVLRASV